MKRILRLVSVSAGNGLITDTLYVNYEPFNKGEYLIPAYIDDHFGYINVFGMVKIPFRYDRAEQFENGRAKVRYHAQQDETDLYDFTKNRMKPVYIVHHGNVTETGDHYE